MTTSIGFYRFKFTDTFHFIFFGKDDVWQFRYLEPFETFILKRPIGSQ